MLVHEQLAGVFFTWSAFQKNPVLRDYDNLMKCFTKIVCQASEIVLFVFFHIVVLTFFSLFMSNIIWWWCRNLLFISSWWARMGRKSELSQLFENYTVPTTICLIPTYIIIINHRHFQPIHPVVTRAKSIMHCYCLVVV